MSEAVEHLLRDFLSWVAKAEPSYPDALDAWRTSCPRLPVWEEAAERGLVARAICAGQVPRLTLTQDGRDFLNPRA